MEQRFSTLFRRAASSKEKEPTVRARLSRPERGVDDHEAEGQQDPEGNDDHGPQLVDLEVNFRAT